MQGGEMLSAKLLEILCCPKCKGDLIYDETNQRLTCENCRLRFLIREDIPVMLINEAEKF